jgi:N-acetylmuramoyl-L-alanine amidase
MRKILLALLIISLPVLAYLMFAPPPDTEIVLIINGDIIEPEPPVVMEEFGGMMAIYVPAVLVCEKLGLETKWDRQNQFLTATLGDFAVKMTVDSSEVETGGALENWTLPIIRIEDTVYMPAYPASKTLGALVKWDEQERKLSFYTPLEFDPLVEDKMQGPLLHVAYPPDRELFYYYGESLFVFGTTQSYARVKVMVNGKPAELHDLRSGNFLTMVEIPRGEEITVIVQATGAGGTTTVERRVFYPTWWEQMDREPLQIHATRLIPADDQLIGAGDVLQVAFQGSPGAEAWYKIGNRDSIYQMTERSYPGGPAGEGGIYTATYKVSENDLPQNGVSAYQPVTVYLSRDDEEISRLLPGRVAFMAVAPYKTVEVKAEHELKNRGWLYSFNPNQLQLLSSTLGGSGYSTSVVNYLVEGTRFKVAGVFGNYYRVVIGDDKNYLINRSVVNDLGIKQLSEPVLAGVELSETENKVSIRLQTTERFPFFLGDGKNSLKLTMHELKASEDLLLPALTESVNDMGLVPGSSDASPSLFNVEVDFEMIGFRTHWVGSELLVELYKPKPGDSEVGNPLQDKIIIVDPGHGGVDTGAPGPGPLNEKDVVLAMSLYLRDMLTDAGAEVIMTRSEDIDLNLYDRPERIDRFNADLFISVHCNAHAPDAPATEIHGLMILYNYAHNEILADIMLQTMAEETELPAFRTWRRNIAVIRHPHIPSVLVEAGYMMHPHDNWYILHPAGQKDLARAMMEGLKNYFLVIENR